MRKTLALLAATALSAGVMSAAPSEAKPPPGFAHLDPGGPASLHERLPVNIVLVGYDRSDVDRGDLLAGLPSSYEPINRSRAFYGLDADLGITIDYKYNVSFTGKRYENRFFGKLKSLSQEMPITEYQQAYNDQVNNVLDVTTNSWIDAPSVEKWLAYNAPRGVDTRRNTVFLVNWWDRPDFEFHVYTKTDEPDPDTGYNFGELRDTRRFTAWGGTTARDEETGLGSTRRVWFHDLSAGPEAWGSSYDVDNADLDGDDVADYRIPPAWEYGSYRAASAVTGDLTKLVQYVALDLLFTTSPLYPVELPTERIPNDINIDSNTYEGWAGVDASSEYIKRPLLMSELRQLLFDEDLSYDNQDLRFKGEARRCFLAQFVDDESCYPETGYPAFANLFLQNLFQLARTQDDGDRVDYELPVFNYSTAEDAAPLLGYADDNWVDGTQSFVFTFLSPGIVEAGYGLTTTIIHEVGHHVALSHPHDGYDSTTGTDFGPTGDLYFAWLGDYSNSIMSYIDVNWDFSQFDLDNMNRFKVAAFVAGANRLAGEALAADHPRRAIDELKAADRAIGAAERAFADHRYVDAVRYAAYAYDLAADGAGDAGVDVPRLQAKIRLDAKVARQAADVHQPGEFIDTLEEGPRSLP